MLCYKFPPETTQNPRWGEAVSLTYTHPQHNIKMTFLPTDFTQVNLPLKTRHFFK
jgi:hypothetical protein